MSIKILLADDSITIQKVVGIIFGGEDYSLTVVDNGKSAVDKAHDLNPDVLLIDALMPGMSGYEVCEAVRSAPNLASKPILLLTGSFEPFDENKAKSCGADDFIAKPFESQQIVNKVKELFELGKSRASAASPSPATPIAAAMPEPPAQEPVPAQQQPSEPDYFTMPEAPPVTFGDSFSAAPVFETQSPFETTSFAPEQPTAPSAASVPVTPVFEATSPFETTSFASVPESAAPVPEPVPVAIAPAIWDAFTPPEPAVAVPATPVQQTVSMPNDDVFAMVQDEPEADPFQMAAPAEHHHHVDSQWVPVEEQSFEFSEERVAEIPSAVFDEPAVEVETASFGDISFATTLQPVVEEIPAATYEPPTAAVSTSSDEFISSPFETSSYQESLETAAFEAVSAPAVPVVEIAAPLAAAAFTAVATPVTPAVTTPTPSVSVSEPAPLTEDQLRAALASVSKEVIERIVWEVVPDLAEVLIKEAIRKIKDGI